VRNGLETILFFVNLRAAEALNSMDHDEGLNGAGESMSIDSGQSRKTNQKQVRVEMDREAQDLPKYLLAKSYFDCKEYDRAAFVLADSQSLKSKFLRLYSKYLVCPLNYTTHLRLGKSGRRKMVKRFLVYALQSVSKARSFGR
jgi:hypothetical protein